MTLRVVAWCTGNVGRHAIAGIDARPDLELVGVWVSNPAKVGKDAGELAGLGRSLGVAATNDVEEVLALQPDCVVNTAMADDRLFEALADLETLLRAGINVVASGPVFLQFPSGPAAGLADGVRQAALDGGASLFVNGIDPGFANDWLPLSLTAISERIDEVRCLEVLNYNTYDQAMILFDVMGFGRPMDDVPMLLQPGDPLDGVGQRRAPDREGPRRRARRGRGVVRAGSRARGLRDRQRHHRGGHRRRAALRGARHAQRTRRRRARARHPAARRPRPRLAAAGRARLLPRRRHAASPTTRSTCSCSGTDGDHNTAGLKATAMRLVNAVPAVVAAAPGLLTSLDLPLVTGRGLVAKADRPRLGPAGARRSGRPP